jgi:xanthine/uracil permease
MPDRRTEWFVPSFGPVRFRLAVGLLFLPYTGMVLSFTVIGSMLAPVVYWDRVAAIVLIYFLGLGIAAHALDAVGSRGARPWGEVFSRRQLWLLAVVSLAAAYAIALWYMVRDTPLLWLIAIPEGFFVLAYNLEWFGGRFHRDSWFAFSWGALPVLAGYVLQTNAISASALLVAAAMALLSLVEIRASRPYKDLKRALAEGRAAQPAEAGRLEGILKSLSGGVIVLGLGLLALRLWG